MEKQMVLSHFENNHFDTEDGGALEDAAKTLNKLQTREYKIIMISIHLYIYIRKIIQTRRIEQIDRWAAKSTQCLHRRQRVVARASRDTELYSRQGRKIFLPSSRSGTVISSLRRILRVSLRGSGLDFLLLRSAPITQLPSRFRLFFLRPRKSDAVRTKFINPPRRAVAPGTAFTPHCASARPRTQSGGGLHSLYRKHAHVPCIKPSGRAARRSEPARVESGVWFHVRALNGFRRRMPRTRFRKYGSAVFHVAALY